MANGKLGGADLSATTETSLYTPGSGVTATVNVSFCNRNSGTDATVKLAIAPSGAGSASNDDYLAFNATVAAESTQIFTGIVVAQEQIIFVESDTASVTALANGFEE